MLGSEQVKKKKDIRNAKFRRDFPMPTRTLSFRPQEPELILETSGAPIVPK